MEIGVTEIVSIMAVVGSLLTALSLYLKNRKDSKRSDLDMSIQIKNETIEKLRQEVSELEKKLESVMDGQSVLKMNKVAGELSKAISEAQSNLVQALYELNGIKITNASLVQENQSLKTHNQLIETKFSKVATELEICSSTVRNLSHHIKMMYDNPTCTDCADADSLLKILQEFKTEL